MALGAVLLSANQARAERAVWFEDDCEGKPQIAFQNISEPTVYGRKAALATGKIRIDREGYTDISEMRSHAGVHAFVLDVTLDGLSGKWGGRATWGSALPLAISVDRPVYLTAFVRTEILSPEISPELAVLFDGKDGKGNPVRGGCLQFKAEGQDPNGWLVFSKDVAAHIRRQGFAADKITGWRLVLNGPSGRPLQKARALLYVDDITFASAPPKIPALSKPGEEAKYQKIEPGPHTVGYMSLYDRFPELSHNRTWNSSFENGFDRWSGDIAPMDADLHIADSAKAVKIVRGDSVHGDCHVEMGDPEGRVSSVSVSTLPFPIKEGRRYTLSFYAKASQPGAVLTAEGCGIYGKYALTGEWKRYSLDIPKMICFNRGAGRQYPGRWMFSFVHRGAATVSLDAVQVEEGSLTEYAYPPLVSVAVHSHYDLGILGATDAPEAYVTVFNGFDAATNAVLETEVRNFRHDSVLKARQTLVLGPRERREIPISFVGAEKLRHWKLTAKVRVDGVVEQEARGAICRVDDVRDLHGADYFGQLGYAGTKVENFDRVLKANRLLGVRRMLVYNNLRRDWENGWRTNTLYDARRDLYLDAVLKAGFVPELAIYPFARELKLEKGTDAHILTDAAIADVDAWVRRFATHLRGRVGHYEVFGEYMRGEMTRRAQNVATLLPVISKALRESAPGCEITAFAEDNMPNICGELEPHFKLDSLDWCDNVSLHPYCIGNENQEILDDAEPAVRRLIDRYAPTGKKIPFSCGEAGHRGVDTLYWDEAESESMYYPIHCTELEYAERVVREIVIGMTHGFSRYIAFYTTCGGFFSFNYLQYGDGDRQRPKTVFAAFNNLVKRLAGFTLVKSFADRDRKLRGAAFRCGDRAVAVVWHYPDDHRPTNARLKFDPKRLRGCNVVGEDFVPTGRNGVTEFALDGSPVFFETDASAANELAAALAALEVDYKGKDTGRFPIARIEKPAGNPFAARADWPTVELDGRHRVSRGIDPTPYGGKDDLSAVVRAASDGERLYIDVEVTDDVRQTPYDADHDKMLIWSNDALQMAFDRADGTGLKEINFSVPPAGEVFFTVANDPIREDLIRFKARTEGAVTEYRIVIPWKALWGDFASGDETRVKFCLAVVDNDGERGNPKLRKFGDRQALQLAPGLYVGGKQSSAYPKFSFSSAAPRASSPWPSPTIRQTGMAEGDVVDPETVFRHPPQAAKTGVWWHWMGTGVSREGIVRDLDWFRDMGIGSATIFAMPDAVLPEALELKGGPMPELVAATPAWWRLVRFATEEAVKRGIEIGLHNCPGYTHTGGPWIGPRHAMRDLVFEIPGKTAVTNYVDKQAIATIDVNGEKVVVSHVAKRSFNYPAQKGATGYECDKMSAEAVNAHWDRVLGDVKEHLGDLVGKGFNFLHADSYEAKRPSWTPKMREEFVARRGYDPVPLLPVLAGMDCCPPEKAKAFAADFNKTIRELYRDNVFRLSAERLHAAGLEFSCEPYGDTPIDPAMCGVYADRVMTEFWTGGEPWEEPMPPPEQWTYRMNWTDWTRVRDGRHPNVIGAEAFTGWPESCRWTETPSRLKRVGDYRYVTGVNHFVLHSVPLQPWGDGIRPGMTFGCWGTHFGRTQTWARDGKAWFGYLNRCQALLQWGSHAPSRGFPLEEGLAQCVRRQGPVTVRFIVNAAESDVVFSESGEWFDPVAGTVGAPPPVLVPGQSGFLVTGRPGKVPPKKRALPVPLMTVRGPWTISWKSAALGAAPIPETNAAAFFEWTTSDNPEIRHFSGTATYRTTFDCAEPNKAAFLSVGDVQGQMAHIRLNGSDLGVVWCAPTRVAVPPGLVKKTDNLLEIDYTNTWANRLIGDEAYPPLTEWKARRCLNRAIGASPTCYPAFLSSGQLPEGTKRSTFSMWNCFSAETPLVPAGLVGPVRLLGD